MSNYLLFGDLHISDRPPSSCTDSYLDDLFEIMERIGDIARERSVAAVICAGDWFHHKTPGRTTHKTVMRCIEVTRAFPCPVYVVPGNHDMLHDRIESIDATQPLGVVIASGAVQLLNGWMDPLDLDEASDFTHPVFGVPWLMRFEDDIVDAALADYHDMLSEGQHGLVVTHAPLYPPGLELKFEHYKATSWATAMGNHGSVYYGHVHEAHGTYTVDGVTFCNPGAISRGSLHEHNLTRAVSCALWDSTTGQFTIVEIPHKPAAAVFRLTEVGEQKAVQARLDDFLGAIGQTRIEITSTEAVMAHIRSLRLGEHLEALAEELLIEGANR